VSLLDIIFPRIQAKNDDFKTARRWLSPFENKLRNAAENAKGERKKRRGDGGTGGRGTEKNAG
jgi:hypothetical protein